jgi:hypothetical protein
MYVRGRQRLPVMKYGADRYAGRVSKAIKLLSLEAYIYQDVLPILMREVLLHEAASGMRAEPIIIRQEVMESGF